MKRSLKSTLFSLMVLSLLMAVIVIAAPQKQGYAAVPSSDYKIGDHVTDLGIWLEGPDGSMDSTYTPVITIGDDQKAKFKVCYFVDKVPDYESAQYLYCIFVSYKDKYEGYCGEEMVVDAFDLNDLYEYAEAEKSLGYNPDTHLMEHEVEFTFDKNAEYIYLGVENLLMDTSNGVKPERAPQGNAKVKVKLEQPYHDPDEGKTDIVLSRDVKNFKLSKSTYTAGKDNKVPISVSFDMNMVPETTRDIDGLFGIFVSLDGKNWEPSTTIFRGYSLKKKGNKFDLEYDLDKDYEYISIVDYNVHSEETLYVGFGKVGNYSVNGDEVEATPAGKPPIIVTLKVTKSAAEQWDPYDMLSNFKMAKDTYSLGAQQKVQVQFNCKMGLAEGGHIDDDVYIYIYNDAGDNVAKKKVDIDSLKAGKNVLDIPCRFPTKGTYYALVSIQESLKAAKSDSHKLAKPLEFVVKKATGADGKEVDTLNSIKPQYLFYSKGQGKNFKIYYSVDDTSSNYRIYCIEGGTYSYKKDTKKILKGTDLMSKLGEFKLQLGKTCEVTVNTEFKNFGLYTLVLFNETTKQLAAEESFYVVPEKYLIQRDVSTMTDTGDIPFSCSAKIQNLDFDKAQTIKFEVGFPLKFSEYKEEFELRFGQGCKYIDGYNPSNYYSPEYGSGVNVYSLGDEDAEDGFDDIDEAFFGDDYAAYMTVKYVPEGSKESRILYRDKLRGMYKTHKIEINSKDLMNKIYETCGSDIGYAGVVTVEFSNEKGALGFTTIANEAIKYFTESFSFGVYKASGIKSAKTDKTTERAYGEKVKIDVTDTLGGKIYADIYNGKKKVATAEGKCSLNKNGTASGTVTWNLQNSSHSYCPAGSYTAKVYTVNEYYVFDKNGKKSLKKVTSKVKNVSFKLVKPKRKLTLSAKAVGSSGENFIYIENPVINVFPTVNIGSMVTVTIKNPSGKKLASSTSEIAKGTGALWLNLGSGLKAGKYKAEISAVTLDKDKKSTSVSFEVKKMPKPAINNANVSVTSAGAGSVTFKVTQQAKVVVKVNGKEIINQTYSGGTNIKGSFSCGGFKAGTYNVDITATNSGGSVKVTKQFTIKNKPATVTKPTANSLNIRYINASNGDVKYQGTFNYSGKGATVVVDIMWNDAEEIVYSYVGTTKNDSGTFTFTWDGYKDNGFKAWAGSYTMRVYLVNSAGYTEDLRRNFDVAAG